MQQSRSGGLEKYLSSYAFSKSMARLALTTSISDLRDDVQKFLKKEWGETPPVWHAAAFIKDVLGSSIWVARAGFRTINSLVDNPWFDRSEVSTETHQYIVNRVAEGKKIPLGPISLDQIFHSIFKELCRAHVEGWNSTALKIPKVKCTIVLVPGVLNELYRNAAFERAARHLSKHYKIKYFTPKVNGRKGTTYNSQLLAQQLKDYIAQNQHQRLWLIGYSKGGVDCLHFMRTNRDFAEKYILGLSTIATPILGSEIPDNHPVLRVVRRLDPIFKSKFYQRIDKGRDLIGIELQKSLAQSRQGNWFKRNHKLLPKNCFYTSLALNANWHESHLWMILTKIIFPNRPMNDGIVSTDDARFPNYFSAYNFGTIRGHHLIGAQSSLFNQEALLETHLLLMHYLKKLK